MAVVTRLVAVDSVISLAAGIAAQLTRARHVISITAEIGVVPLEIVVQALLPVALVVAHAAQAVLEEDVVQVVEEEDVVVAAEAIAVVAEAIQVVEDAGNNNR